MVAAGVDVKARPNRTTSGSGKRDHDFGVPRDGGSAIPEGGVGVVERGVRAQYAEGVLFAVAQRAFGMFVWAPRFGQAGPSHEDVDAAELVTLATSVASPYSSGAPGGG